MKLKTATFAGGCFWCMVPPFEKLNGVMEVFAGYAGGTSKDPTYQNMGDHLECVQVYYNPDLINYEQLLETFWKQINPEDVGGQFNDRGNQYQTAILYNDNKEKTIAEKSKKQIQKKFKEPVATKIIKLTFFTPAEEYYQDYYKKNVIRYKIYKTLSGREGYLKKTWG